MKRMIPAILAHILLFAGAASAADEPIKSIGEFSVPVRLHGDVTAQLKVSVTRE